MLDQKRSSWLREINLRYVVAGEEPTPPSPETIRHIETEISGAERDLRASESKAAAFSGGLIQAMAFVEVQTHRVTIAAAKQRNRDATRRHLRHSTVARRAEDR
jgi:hypothetical protein